MRFKPGYLFRIDLGGGSFTASQPSAFVTGDGLAVVRDGDTAVVTADADFVASLLAAAVAQADDDTTAAAGAVMSLAVLSNDAGILAFLERIAALDAGDRAEYLGDIQEGVTNPGELIYRDATGVLSGYWFTPASLADQFAGTPDLPPQDPESMASFIGANLWQGSDITAADTITISGGYHVVNGNTTITDIDFAQTVAGRSCWLRFTGTPQITRHVTTLEIYPTNATITIAAGDWAYVVSEGGDNVKLFHFTASAGGLDEWTEASASGASSLDFYEDTDNGTNRVRLQGPASTADVTVTLPAVTGTLLTGASGEGATPNFTGINLGSTDTDTTITRLAAGQPGVEGVYVQLAGTTELNFPAACWVGATTSGAEPVVSEMPTNKPMVSGFAFDTSADEYADLMIVLPKRWNIGTVTYRVHWYHASSNATATVTWALQGLAVSNDDTMDAAFGTAVRVVDDGATGLDAYLSDTSSALTIAGTPAAADTLFFRLSRDVDGNGTAGNDDLAQDAIMTCVDIFITTNAATDA